ncbi:MAG TPA: hypothetical protein VFT55_05530 [Planctomycetota bacterium]|nr:hypothetical protein [Planctomycetota bacterium]
MAIRGIEAIFADLLQEDPPRTGTNVLATEVLALFPDEAADYLFRAMRDRPSEVAHGAIVLLLAELAGRDDRWQRLVSKSLTKAGRCPRGLRAQLRQALLGSPHDRGGPRPVPLTDETTEEKHRQTPPPADVKRTGRHLKLTIDTASTNIQHLGTLVNALARADRELSGVKVCELDLRSVDHLFIGGLVVLAAWCGRRGIRPQLKNVSAGTRDYLNKVGFDRWVDGSFATGLIQDIQGWGVAVSSLGSRDPEELAGELTEICVKHGWIGQRDRNALVILFSELTENVRRHGGAGAAATVGAQFYPGRRKLVSAR